MAITDTYYCLVENSGISLYADGKSESHVAYMAEFQIDRVVHTPHGLIVIPIQQIPNDANDSHDSKYLYVLTHPAKQVSRVWVKASGNGNKKFLLKTMKYCINAIDVVFKCVQL